MQKKQMPEAAEDAAAPQTTGGHQHGGGLGGLATPENGHGSLHLGARLRNYLFTGLVVVGPVTITIYTVWWFINWVDAWVKPFLPRHYNPENYLPFPLPGLGLIIALLGLMLIGALAANLIGRTLISSSELMLERTPIVRNVYRALKQLFESALAAGSTAQSFQKVGLIEFPSKGIWSLVFITGETSGEIQSLRPGGHDMMTVFIPTGIVPPTGFVSFVPRKEVIPLRMSIEDAAKLIISGGMVVPDQQARLKKLAEQEGAAEIEAGGKAEGGAGRRS